MKKLQFFTISFYNFLKKIFAIIFLIAFTNIVAAQTPTNNAIVYPTNTPGAGQQQGGWFNTYFKNMVRLCGPNEVLVGFSNWDNPKTADYGAIKCKNINTMDTVAVELRGNLKGTDFNIPMWSKGGTTFAGSQLWQHSTMPMISIGKHMHDGRNLPGANNTAGSILSFDGAPENSDAIRLYRFNRRPDGTDLRFLIGDNITDETGDSVDRIQFGGHIMGTNNFVAKVTMYTSGRLGIKTETPESELDVNGRITIRGWNPGLGRVLVSDNATGLAVWKSPDDLGITSCKSAGTGINNTCLGVAALGRNTTGHANTAVGVNALANNTTGLSNTAFGFNSLMQNISGNYNAIFGTTAGQKNTTGNNNTAFGTAALRENTTGHANTAIGVNALMQKVAGNNNTTLGQASGYRLTNGNNNTFLGYSAGHNSTTGDNNIAIGANVNLLSLTGSNQLNIGNWIFGTGGNIGIGETNPKNKLVITKNADVTGLDNNPDNGILILQSSSHATRGYKLFMDENELQTTTDGRPELLNFNPYGGAISIGAATAGSGSIQSKVAKFLFENNPTIQSFTRFAADNNANYIQSGLEGVVNSAKDLRFTPAYSTTPWLTLTKEGRVWIGMHSPLSKLHIKASDSVASLVTLENNANKKWLQGVWQGNAFGIWENDPSFENQRFLVYPGGNITMNMNGGNTGIGTVPDVSAKLDINGKIRIRGGNPALGKILTSEAGGLSVWKSPSELGITICKAGGTGLSNNCFGNFSLQQNTTGSSNNAFGDLSLQQNTTGLANNAFGNGTLRQNTTGLWNSVFGHAALERNTTGNSNSVFGISAASNNTTGHQNSIFGSSAFGSNISGTYNVAMGSSSLASNVGGSYNAAIGHTALIGSLGSNNSALGSAAGHALVNGDNNVFLGKHAGMGLLSWSNNIAIGAWTAFPANNNASNQLNIGNWIYGNNGNIGIGINAPASKLDVNGELTARNWYGHVIYFGGDRVNNDMEIGTNNPSLQKIAFYNRATNEWLDIYVKNIHGWDAYLANTHANAFFYNSDERLKENISTISDASNILQKLRGVTFDWKSTGKKTFGFIAQEVEKVVPELVHTDENGYKSVEYGNFVSILLEGYKSQQVEIENLQKELESQRQDIQFLKQEIDKLKNTHK